MEQHTKAHRAGVVSSSLLDFLAGDCSKESYAGFLHFPSKGIEFTSKRSTAGGIERREGWAWLVKDLQCSLISRITHFHFFSWISDQSVDFAAAAHRLQRNLLQSHRNHKLGFGLSLFREFHPDFLLKGFGLGWGFSAY